MSIQLEYYRVFLVVAREGGITRAAEALHLTQSAVSQTIHRLEEELDAALFVRSSRGVALTDAGQLLLERIGGLLDQVDGVERYFQQLRQLETGSLKIGASDTLCRALLLPHLQTFRDEYPDVTLQVTNRTSGETVELLRRGRVDIGFVNLPLEQDGALTEFEIRDIVPLHDCFICGEALRPFFSEPVSLSALSAYPILMLERLSAGRRYLDRVLEERGTPLVPEIELGSLDLLVEFARTNLGIAAVTRELIRPGTPGIHIIHLKEQIPPRRMGMLWKRLPPLPRAAARFAEMLLDTVSI